jgi:hypothetical protein
VSTPATTVPAKSIDAYRDYILGPDDAAPADGAIKVTWYGTTMFVVDYGQTRMLSDAFITRPSLATAVESMKTEKALIATDTAMVDAWLVRPEVGKRAALFVAHTHKTTRWTSPSSLRRRAGACTGRTRR